MTVDLTIPMFHDVDAAREWLESSRWPTGPICPHCDDKAVIAGGEGAPNVPFPLPQLPRAVHRTDRLGDGTHPPPVAQVGAGNPADELPQKRGLGPPTAPLPGADLQRLHGSWRRASARQCARKIQPRSAAKARSWK